MWAKTDGREPMRWGLCASLGVFGAPQPVGIE